MTKRDEMVSDEDAAAFADAAIGPELDSHVSRAYAPKRILAVGRRMNGRTMTRTTTNFARGQERLLDDT